jgi:hypothetical protein
MEGLGAAAYFQASWHSTRHPETNARSRLRGGLRESAGSLLAPPPDQPAHVQRRIYIKIALANSERIPAALPAFVFALVFDNGDCVVLCNGGVFCSMPHWRG